MTGVWVLDDLNLKPEGRSQSVVGRDVELSELDHLLREPEAGRGAVLVGGPGIGKTTLWEAAVAAARDRGERVLTARPSGSELELPFAGLIDLCDGLGQAELAQACQEEARALL